MLPALRRRFALEEGEGVTNTGSALGYDRMLGPSRWEFFRRLPAMLRQASELTSRTAPGTVASFAVLQVLTGLGIAAQLLVARCLLTPRRSEGPN